MTHPIYVDLQCKLTVHGGKAGAPHRVAKHGRETNMDEMAALRVQYPEKKIILVTLNDLIPMVPKGIFDETIPIEYDVLLIPVIKNSCTRVQF